MRAESRLFQTSHSSRITLGDPQIVGSDFEDQRRSAVRIGALQSCVKEKKKSLARSERAARAELQKIVVSKTGIFGF